jgi:hypothetical protein
VIEERAKCRLWAVPASVSLGMRMPKAGGGTQDGKEGARAGDELVLMCSEQQQVAPMALV